MTERRQATDEEARALASSLRQRILRICLDEVHTNKEIAERLGRDPASTLHHVRTLVRTGFLESQAERRGTRGAREVPYLATKKSWRLSTPGSDRSMLETFLDELALVPDVDVDTTRMGLRLSPAEMADFRGRLRDLLDDFAERPHDPLAPAWSVFITIHPDPNRPFALHSNGGAVQPGALVTPRSIDPSRPIDPCTT